MNFPVSPQLKIPYYACKDKDQRRIEKCCRQTDQTRGHAVPPDAADAGYILTDEYVFRQNIAQNPVHIPECGANGYTAAIKGDGDDPGHIVAHDPNGLIPAQ